MHVDFGHFFDNLFAVISLIFIMLNLLAIVFIWFFTEYKNYIYAINALMFAFVLKVGAIELEMYQSHKEYEKSKLEEKEGAAYAYEKEYWIINKEKEK